MISKIGNFVIKDVRKYPLHSQSILYCKTLNVCTLFYFYLQLLCLVSMEAAEFSFIPCSDSLEGSLALFYTTAACVFIFVSLSPFKYLLLCVVFPLIIGKLLLSLCLVWNSEPSVDQQTSWGPYPFESESVFLSITYNWINNKKTIYEWFQGKMLNQMDMDTHTQRRHRDVLVQAHKHKHHVHKKRILLKPTVLNIPFV